MRNGFKMLIAMLIYNTLAKLPILFLLLWLLWFLLLLLVIMMPVGETVQ